MINNNCQEYDFVECLLPRCNKEAEITFKNADLEY